MMAHLRYIGDEVLRTLCDPITEIDSETRALAAEMRRLMHAHRGIGIAAPQVGATQRIVMIDQPGYRDFALVNPSIASASADLALMTEGCLSIPEFRASVTRPRYVTVIATDLEGEPVAIEADGMLARLLQHEIDHLDGVLFTDKVVNYDKAALQKKLRKIAKRTKQGHLV